MGKKKNYRFWRWLILMIVRVDKLYALAWGIVVLLVLICLKNDLVTLVVRLLS